MGIFSEEVKTSITLYIENLSNYEEIEWYQFQQLTESISMQPNGAREAVEAIRKKLKHGTTHQKLRVLEVLKLLMENSNQRFHKELICNDKMRDRFGFIINSPAEDVTVRKTLVMLLGIWASKFEGEQGMQILQRLHEQGRKNFGDNSNHRPQHSKKPREVTSASSPERTNSSRKKVPPPPLRNPPKNHRDAQEHLNLPPPNDIGSHRQRSVSSANWDFEKAKPKIIQEIALATQSANNLINALRLINTTKDDWEVDMRRDHGIQQAHQRCEEEKKKIVRYARSVEDEEWIGTLLAANEDLLKALDMYDIMLTGQIPSDLPNSPYTKEPLALLASTDYYSEDVSSDLSNLQLTKQSDGPRGEDGEMLEDPFADPV